MKAIYKLFIFNLFTLLALSACNDEDSVDDVIDRKSTRLNSSH